MSDQNSAGTAVATREPRKQSAVEQLMTSERARSYIEPFLPKGADIQRVAASVMLAFAKDETGLLRRCTPESLVLGVARIQQWRLELGVTAYLLPFKNSALTDAAKKADPKAAPVYEATPVADYKGLAELIHTASGIMIEPHVVRDGDEFRYAYGLTPILHHTPRAAKNATITHAYVIVRPPRHGTPTFEVMTAEEINGIREKYSKQWKTGPLPAWYAQKCVIRRVAKLLPKNPELAEFMKVLRDDAETELSPEAVARLVDDDRDDAPAVEAGADKRGEDLAELDDRWIEHREREPGQEG